MSARQFGMYHRTVVPENFERPATPAADVGSTATPDDESDATDADEDDAPLPNAE